MGAETPPPTPELSGYAFIELAADAGSGVAIAELLGDLGFAQTGMHRSKPVQLWQQGDARVLLNTTDPDGAAVGALGIETADPTAAAGRATALLAPPLPQHHGPAEADLLGVTAPDGTAVFFCHTATEGVSWLADFAPTGATGDVHVTHVDHVALTQPYDNFDEATLFYRSLLGLQTQHASEVAAPFGLVRNRAVSDANLPCGSACRCRRCGAAAGRPAWPTPSTSRSPARTSSPSPAGPAPPGRRCSTSPTTTTTTSTPASPPSDLAELRELGVLSTATRRRRVPALLHPRPGRSRVLRGRAAIGGYSGYGEVNGPIRMAAHRRARLSP